MAGENRSVILGKTIVITGAGVGLGRRLAQRLHADGDTVILLGRTAAKVEAVAAELGERAAAFGCDVASPEAVKAAFGRIAERFDKIDVLINNAAIFEPALVVEASDDHILNTININLTGPVLCVRAALPLMGRGGHIFNISSESIDVPFAHLLLYQSSKAGLERFSTGLQQELEGTGINVTIVRAGQMFEEGKAWDVGPETLMRFAQANAERGINLMQRPISQFTSVADLFRSLIDLPPDLHVLKVQLTARIPA